MIEVENAEDGEEIVVGYSFAAHGAEGIGVDDLLAERAGAKVGSLGDVEDLSEGRLAHCTPVDGPEAAENAE